MIEPQERALWLLVACMALALCGLSWPALTSVSLGAVGLWLLVFAIDFALIRAPQHVQVRVDAAPTVRHELTHLRVELTCPHRQQQHSELTLTLPLSPCEIDGVEVKVSTTGHVEHSVRWRWRSHGTHAFSVRFAQPGRAPLPPCTLRQIGPLGLVARRQRLRLPAMIRVNFDLGRIVQQAAQHTASEARHRHGQRRDAADAERLGVREYRPGDDVRHMAWKLSARRSTLLLKDVAEPGKRDVLLVQNRGRQLLGRTLQAYGGHERLMLSSESMLHAASVLLLRGHRVRLLAIDDTCDVVAEALNISGLGTLQNALVDARAKPVEPQWPLLARAVAGTQRSHVLVWTDLLDRFSTAPLLSTIAPIRTQHHVAIFALRDPVLDERPPAATSRAVAIAHLQQVRSRALLACTAAGAATCEVPLLAPEQALKRALAQVRG